MKLFWLRRGFRSERVACVPKWFDGNFRPRTTSHAARRRFCAHGHRRRNLFRAGAAPARALREHGIVTILPARFRRTKSQGLLSDLGVVFSQKSRTSKRVGESKSEVRNPKEIRDPNNSGVALELNHSDFGFRISFGLRISVFDLTSPEHAIRNRTRPQPSLTLESSLICSRVPIFGYFPNSWLRGSSRF